MPQDAFTLKYVTEELNGLFIGGKISKINQPGKDLLSLLIYTRRGTVKLDMDFSAKFCRISAGEDGENLNPENAPNFCMLLRKHLANAEILSVEQIGFERVIKFSFRCFSEFSVTDMQLYAEIMGKYSNAILVKDSAIVGALKSASLENSAKRIILTGAKYRLPERQEKCDPTDLTALKTLFAQKPNCDAAEFISGNVAGIAYVTAENIAAKFGEGVTAEELYGYVNDKNYSPCVIYRGGVISDFGARLCEGASPRESILKAQAEFYGRAVGEKKFADEKRKLHSALSSALKKAEKQLAQIYEKLEECKKADELKLKGELITANIYAIERGAAKFNAVNYYEENSPQITIDLDPTLTPSQNAQKYFKKYSKLKRTAQVLAVRKEETERKLDYLKSIESNLTLAESTEDFTETRQELISLSLLPPELKRKGAKPKKETPFRTYSCGGFKIVCGRNNAQNDRLTKSLSPADIWLHVKGYHSSHTGIITGGKTPADEVIKFAAEVCAYYSEARQKGKTPVDFTLKKFVKKPNGANPGFAVYTDFKTILVAPDAHTENRYDE